MGGACSPASTLRNQFRSTSARCWTRPVIVKPDGGTGVSAACSSSRPSHFIARVARWKSSQLSSVVRSSAFRGGMGRSMVVIGRLFAGGSCRGRVGGAGRRWLGSGGSLEGADDGRAFDRLEAGEVGQPGRQVGVEVARIAEDRAGGEVGGAGGGAGERDLGVGRDRPPGRVEAGR